VIGDEPIAAIYSTSETGITNTARSGIGLNCPITPQIEKICRDAAHAIRGGTLAIVFF